MTTHTMTLSLDNTNAYHRLHKDLLRLTKDSRFRVKRKGGALPSVRPQVSVQNKTRRVKEDRIQQKLLHIALTLAIHKYVCKII